MRVDLKNQIHDSIAASDLLYGMDRTATKVLLSILGSGFAHAGALKEKTK